MRAARKALGGILVVAAAATATMATTTAATATTPMTPTQARAADDLANMIGVNIHTLSGTTTYGNFAMVEQRLKTLGVRHVRDYLGVARPDQVQKSNQLYADGIDTDFVVSPTTATSDLAARISSLTAFAPGVVAAVEPPNEWNISGDRNWAADIRNYTIAMSNAVRATPALNNAEIYGPAMALRTGYSDVGDLSSYLTDGNFHLYTGGQTPTHYLDQVWNDEQVISGNLPEVVTETGFHDALKTTSTHPPTSDAAEAVYEPRIFLEYFLRGAHRVYQYELCDEHNDPTLTDKEDHFGLVHADGTPRPAYYVLRNFIALVNDHGAKPAQLGSLSYSVDSGSTPIEQTLVERADGSYVLFLWRDVAVWNWQTRQPINVASAPVTVHFDQPVSSVAIYHPSNAMAASKTIDGTSQIGVGLAGGVVALSITP